MSALEAVRIAKSVTNTFAVSGQIQPKRMLPAIHWRAMLRGKEWLAKPELVG